MKNLPFYIILIFSFLVKLNSVAQQPELIWIHGKVINHSDSIPIPNAQVASFKMVRIFACDSLGEFKSTFPKGDSLMVTALGFEPKVFSRDSLNNDELVIFDLESKSYMLDKVDVSGFKEFREFTDYLIEEREKQKELEFPSYVPYDTMAYAKPIYHNKPPILVALFQPINYIYYYTSPSERQKIKSLREVQEDKIRSRLTRNLVHQLTELDGEKLDKFLIYCNTKIHLTEQDNEISITNKVMDLYFHYQQEKEK
ncbi:hypothetical protein [Carboxylicivirga caseinilyticus]|uniref:hypothetical protein n=1 Tax=Carboxylicivirga caseinilyticus TaxID=3417572 RepID=UPI003D34F09A|nr:hypothetical protein [Marinilabiliaceae bacterium A049]